MVCLRIEDRMWASRESRASDKNREYGYIAFSKSSLSISKKWKFLIKD